MGNRVSISKAARLLGLDRRELCERLCRAGIESFEGAVDVEDVRSISPKMNMNDGLMNERVRLIRKTARRRQAVAQPRRAVQELQDEIDRLHNQWLMERQRAQEYYDLFDRLVDELGRWQNSDDEDRAAFALDFSKWLCKTFDD